MAIKARAVLPYLVPQLIAPPVNTRALASLAPVSGEALHRHLVSLVADHGRADWLGCWDEFVQKARFKKLVCLHHIKQNNLTYLGQVCMPCLSVSTRIYGLVKGVPFSNNGSAKPQV